MAQALLFILASSKFTVAINHLVEPDAKLFKLETMKTPFNISVRNFCRLTKLPPAPRRRRLDKALRVVIAP